MLLRLTCVLEGIGLLVHEFACFLEFTSIHHAISRITVFVALHDYNSCVITPPVD